ncbi:Peptidase M8 [Trypanosoma melophagium]|uniref:Peptidase M8 n=1 Tax=Trypanosoma melophagium TaxID=715481 RepID=UPI00351A74B3|nr:Peptidase M8 [Trypanosoma melophagium]
MTKYSMRHLLCIALFLLYCTCGCFAASVVQQLPQKGQSALQTYTVSDAKNGENWKPIRIGVYTKFVEDVMMYCKTKNQGLEEYEQLKTKIEEKPEYDYNDEELAEQLGEEIAQLKLLCNGADGMTEDKKNILFRDILPKAIKLHTDRLEVNRFKVGENNQIRSVTKSIQIGCELFRNPVEKNVQGSDYVDFMIYVGLWDSYKKVEICTQEKEKGRPTSAVIGFIPKEIKPTRQYIRLTAHEIAHGLGFEYNLMKDLGMIKDGYSYPQSTRVSTRGKVFSIVKSSKTVEMMENHYKCEKGKLEGLYLENGNFGKPSHWERRIAKDELMSTYSNSMGVTGMYYTVLTLAAFEDMGFYRAKFDMAEPMISLDQNHGV